MIQTVLKACKNVRLSMRKFRSIFNPLQAIQYLNVNKIGWQISDPVFNDICILHLNVYCTTDLQTGDLLGWSKTVTPFSEIRNIA